LGRGRKNKKLKGRLFGFETYSEKGIESIESRVSIMGLTYENQFTM
jgi:hypothetical protein